MSKLIRDGYVNEIEADKLDTTNKSNKVKLELILDKFKEEALEFLESKQRDPEELADLMEVVIGWGEMNGYSFECVNSIRKRKLLEKGGFKNFVVLKDD